MTEPSSTPGVASDPRHLVVNLREYPFAVVLALLAVAWPLGLGVLHGHEVEHLVGRVRQLINRNELTLDPVMTRLAAHVTARRERTTTHAAGVDPASDGAGRSGQLSVRPATCDHVHPATHGLHEHAGKREGPRRPPLDAVHVLSGLHVEVATSTPEGSHTIANEVPG